MTEKLKNSHNFSDYLKTDVSKFEEEILSDIRNSKKFNNGKFPIEKIRKNEKKNDSFKCYLNKSIDYYIPKKNEEEEEENNYEFLKSIDGQLKKMDEIISRSKKTCLNSKEKNYGNFIKKDQTNKNFFNNKKEKEPFSFRINSFNEDTFEEKFENLCTKLNKIRKEKEEKKNSLNNSRLFAEITNIKKEDKKYKNFFCANCKCLNKISEVDFFTLNEKNGENKENFTEIGEINVKELKEKIYEEIRNDIFKEFGKNFPQLKE